MVWVDRDGREEPIPAPPIGSWTYTRLSPDGKRVAVDVFGSTSERQRDIYIWDLERENLSRLTDDPSADAVPWWSADGRTVFFSSNRGGVFNLYSRASDGTGKDELFLKSDVKTICEGLTPDGKRLLANAEDILEIDLEEPHQARALLATPSWEGAPTFSPDGEWVAYESDIEGQIEVYVGPYPDLGSRKWKISSGGGRHPLWSPRGDEIYFRDLAGNMMAARATLEPTFAAGTVTQLFRNACEQPYFEGGGRGYDVSRFDGRFLMVKEGKVPPARLVVVLNWFQELRAKVPVD
jgi:Tol biopolymer transport system component